jgi:hypothetical protein
MDPFNAGESSSKPDNYLQFLQIYREAIQNISHFLMRTNWGELRGTSPEFLTAQFMLQNTVSILKELEEDVVNKWIEITAILEHLIEVLTELSLASVIADQVDVQQRSKPIRFKKWWLNCFRNNQKSRKYLNYLAELMNYI